MAHYEQYPAQSISPLSSIPIHPWRRGCCPRIHGRILHAAAIRRSPAPIRPPSTPLQTLASIRPSPRSLVPFWTCPTPSSPWPSSIPWPLPSPSPRTAPKAPPASAASSTLKNASRVPLLRPDRDRLQPPVAGNLPRFEHPLLLLVTRRASVCLRGEPLCRFPAFPLRIPRRRSPMG